MSSPTDEGSSRSLSTVRRSIDVIKALEALDGAGVTELADHLDMSKSGVYNHLATLRDAKFVVKEGESYRLSLQFLMLGEYVRNQNTLYEIGKPEIDKLAEGTGEYAHLATEQHGLGVNLYKLPGDKAVGADYQRSKLQNPDYLHFSATGKAILAYLPTERVEEILDQYGLVAKTANTITDRDELFDELERIRDRGYATNDEEEIEGLRAIGAPILDSDGGVLGSLSVSGPTNRMHDEAYHEEIVEEVINAANVIEVNINMARVSTEFPDLR